jgi:hypothetical protein
MEHAFRVPQWPLCLLSLLPFLRVKETFLRRVTNRKILNYCHDILNYITEECRRFILVQLIVSKLFAAEKYVHSSYPHLLH